MTKTRNKLTIRKDENGCLIQIGDFKASDGNAIVLMPICDDQGDDSGFKAMTAETPDLHIFYVPVGGTKMWCLACEVSIENFGGCHSSLTGEVKNEMKRKAREARCIVPGCNGKAIRCPESNSCYGCPRAGNLDTKTGTPISYDQLCEALGVDRFDGEESTKGDSTRPDDVLSIGDNPLDVIMHNYKRITEPDRLKELHKRLREASKGKTVYVPSLDAHYPTLEAIAIFLETSETDGNHIAEKKKARETLNICERTFSKYIRKIAAIIREYYSEIDMSI